ncbi:acetyl-CoA carboxylase biotin carboxyl carrier protein [Vogesella oryzae]|uniref:acetyl-CoA carboxylase biotin carboxyl carrier protein n=1 Tax=Vogesella oryzae TaxID=1735285 RepID=UPI001583FD91|nr:acetyl-CoA carboxylase biotin carboxyl carrier protein [Vogesella oryzae]
MELRKLKQLLQLVQHSGITELDVSIGGEQIRIRRGSAASPLPILCAPPAAAISVPQLAATPSAPQAPAVDEQAQCSPMPGTCYLAPAPGAAAFVQLGQQVQAGDTLCIVEAMKLMNSIEAERSGTLRAILVADGDNVQSGTPLFRID